MRTMSWCCTVRVHQGGAECGRLQEVTQTRVNRSDVVAQRETPEQEVADLLPIDADPEQARTVLDAVPLWFHTFCLNSEQGLYTPGVAKDHRYRFDSIPEDFSGRSVLDVGTFDGFYAFLAEARGARRVLATDNEQYRAWAKSRWGVELRGAEGFHAIKDLLGSEVEYRKLDAFDHDRLEEQFDVIFCFGILHRVVDPLGMFRVLASRLNENGRILLETYGVAGDEGAEQGFLQVHEPRDIYASDDYTYWGFTGGSLDRLATHAGLRGSTIYETPVIDGHPRIIGVLER